MLVLGYCRYGMDKRNIYLPNPGNHEQHESRGGDHPGDITGLAMVVSYGSRRERER